LQKHLPESNCTTSSVTLTQTRQAEEKRAEHQSEAAVAVAAAAASVAVAMAMAMTAKRGPSGDEMRCSGHRARARRVEEGETDHPSAAELRTSLSTRDQVRACVRCAPARARVLQCRLLPLREYKDSLERLRSRIVCFGTAVLMRVRVLCGLQEIEEMRRRLRELEKLEFEIPPAPSHGNSFC